MQNKQPKHEDHLCALANGDVAQHGRAGANEHIGLHLGVAVPRVLARACSRTPAIGIMCMTMQRALCASHTPEMKIPLVFLFTQNVVF